MTTETVEYFAEGAAVAHGAHILYATIPCKRHYYAGSDGSDPDPRGYVEVLTFSDPPSGKPHVVIHRKKGRQRHAFHFADLETALEAAKTDHIWMTDPDMPEEPGKMQIWMTKDIPGLIGQELFNTHNPSWFMRR